jgi:hypothetical protein
LLTVADTGQSRIRWFSSATPAWLEVSAPASVTFDFQDTAAFVVLRERLTDPANGFGATEFAIVTITATTFDGATVDTQDIRVEVTQ